MLPAWRDALFTMSFVKAISETIGWDNLRETQAQPNIWRDQVRSVTLLGGTHGRLGTIWTGKKNIFGQIISPCHK